MTSSQDIIGWDPFIMRMVSTRLLQIQSTYLLQCHSLRPALSWISELIAQLLQVMHSQWIYRCILVHDWTIGTLILAHKDDLLKEINHQLSL